MNPIAGLARMIRRLSPHCRDAAQVMSRARDERPPRLDRFGLAMHLLICPACRRYRQSMTFLMTSVKGLTDVPATDTAPSLPPDARQRIASALSQAPGGEFS